MIMGLVLSLLVYCAVGCYLFYKLDVPHPAEGSETFMQYIKGITKGAGMLLIWPVVLAHYDK